MKPLFLSYLLILLVSCNSTPVADDTDFQHFGTRFLKDAAVRNESLNAKTFFTRYDVGDDRTDTFKNTVAQNKEIIDEWIADKKMKSSISSKSTENYIQFTVDETGINMRLLFERVNGAWQLIVIEVLST